MTKVRLSTVYLTYGTLLRPLRHQGDPIIVASCFKESSQQGTEAAPGQSWNKYQTNPCSVSNLTANV